MSSIRSAVTATALVLSALLLSVRPAVADPTPAPSPPTAPAGLAVTAISPVSVTLSWTASAPGCCAVDHYSVRYNAAFNDVFYAQPVGNVTTVTITSYILATTQYTFSVAAVDVDGHQSLGSNQVTVITPASTTGDTTPPGAPTGLRVTATTPAGVALAWTGSADNVAVTGYDVYFFDGWYNSTLVGTVPGTSFTAPILSSSTGMRYYYVRAVDAAGNKSIASNLVSGGTTTTTPPPAPPCEVSYRTTSEWRGGFVAEIAITNTGTAAVDGWTLRVGFPGDQRVSSAWNAAFTQDGADLTLTAARWNRAIAVGATVTVGLLGRWTTSDAAPIGAALNGTPCTLA